MMNRRAVFGNGVVLALFLLAGGMAACLTRYELVVDFIQYHYYNGFAFLKDRLGTDIAPASVPTYYNPLLDGLTYALITVFGNHANIYYFIQGLWFGALMFAAYKTAGLFFDTNTKSGRVFVVLAILVCATGSATWFQLGTSTHEIETAVLTMTAFYLLLRDKKRYFVSGLLLGAAAGFKLTAAIYCVSAGLTLILFCKTSDKPLKSIIVFALGGLIGFLIVDGFWMVKLWRLYGNPFFPFWNGIFKSPYYPEINYIDTLHLDGKTVVDHLSAPFLMAYQYGFTLNVPTRDPRMAVAVIVGVFALIICRKQRNKRVLFCAVLALISFAVWDVVSFNARFLIPVEQLAGILIVYAFYRLYRAYPELTIKTAVPYVFATLCLYALLAASVFGGAWGYLREISFFNDKIDLEDNAVLAVQKKSALFAAVRIVEQNPSVTIVQDLEHPEEAWNMTRYGKMRENAEKAIQGASTVYRLFVQTKLAAAMLAMQNPDCSIVPFSDAGNTVVLCKVR